MNYKMLKKDKLDQIFKPIKWKLKDYDYDG